MKKIQLLASAMLTAFMLGAPANAATQTQLQQIQQLASQGDFRALRAFLLANPDMKFSPEMASALTDFLEDTSGLRGLFASASSTASVLSLVQEEGATEPTIY